MPNNKQLQGLVPQSTLLGIALLIASMWSLSAVDSSGKYLMGDDIAVPLLILSLIRYAIHFVLAIAVAVPIRGLNAFRSIAPRAQMIRGIALLAVTLLLFLTLHYLPQAQATSITFLAPLLVLAAAPWILGERQRVSRWIAALSGFIGILILARPSSGLDPIGTIFGLIAAGALAILSISSRRAAVDDPYTTLIWSGCVGSTILFLLLPVYWNQVSFIWDHLTPFQWLILLGTGFWGCLGQYLQIRAYYLAPASLLAPFSYFQIISASAFGWLIWGQSPDIVSWFGIGLIFASGMGVGLLEWRSKNHALLPCPPTLWAETSTHRDTA